MKLRTPLHPDAPLHGLGHGRPLTRRDFLARGLLRGAGLVSSLGVFSLFANPRAAMAALAPDLENLKAGCGIQVAGGGKIPFICFDLAGGASMAGSNVLVGREGGQDAYLSTAGYSVQGLPGNMVPNLGEQFIDRSLGLAFHSDSGFLEGILERTSQGTQAAINGCVIPARSENDTANNPHNPLYGIFRAGADGELLTLAGSRNSESGGNSMAPASLFDPSVRPTKIDRPSDVTGLVNTGKLVGLLNQSDATAVMEAIARISHSKLGQVNTAVTQDAVLKEMMRCGYIEAADITDRYGDPTALNPAIDPDIVGDGGIFSAAEFNSDGEFRKTASIMKLVVEGYAGAGCITIGGYDYHTGERGTGEIRDLRAGRCMGACLEYAARRNTPLMLYVFSDGSVNSNGRIDDSVNGRGKGEWTGDSSGTAASFFLVYNPAGRPQLLGSGAAEQAMHQQLGWMRASGSVETASSPAANNVNLLVETVLLNYMALNGDQSLFANRFPNHSLGNATMLDRMTAFHPIT
ncbi:general secretion pathway protein GspF [Alcanivorax sp. JB21]|uniref:general secretion pathway protein GspF n=1 Tax=Alcanivorax limicola TaxID=2874102 RepID=UPI001CBD19BA|nr:general secretion pathway protein GspF [Alcanivorax limicola]MBZ2190152.1 general secretion pathway protein GspF [Alcanivorax limicola]